MVFTFSDNSHVTHEHIPEVQMTPLSEAELDLDSRHSFNLLAMIVTVELFESIFFLDVKLARFQVLLLAVI